MSLLKKYFFEYFNIAHRVVPGALGSARAPTVLGNYVRFGDVVKLMFSNSTFVLHSRYPSVAEGTGMKTHTYNFTVYFYNDLNSDIQQASLNQKCFH